MHYDINNKLKVYHFWAMSTNHKIIFVSDDVFSPPKFQYLFKDLKMAFASNSQLKE